MGDNDRGETMVAERLKIQNEVQQAGETLGYSDDKLQTYVKEQMIIIDKKMQDKLDRDQRAKELEARRQDQEQELKLLEARRLEREQEIALKKLDVQEQENKIRITGEIQDHDTGFTYNRGNKVPLPNLPTFREDIDRIDAFLDRFETYATCKGWDKTVWSVAVASYLTGFALEVYYKLPKGDRQNYDALSKELLRYYQITDYDYKNKFWSSRCHKDESPTQFISRMSEYFDQWMELSGANTKEKMRDVILRHQFNRACTSELNMFVGERSVSSMDEVRKLTEQFAKVHKNVMLPSPNEDRNSKKKFSKKTDDKSKNDSKIIDKNKPAFNRDTLCFTCNKKGHVARECPSVTCFKCGGQGHKAFNCKANVSKASSGIQQETQERKCCPCSQRNDSLDGSSKAESSYGSEQSYLKDEHMHSSSGCIEVRPKASTSIITHISASQFVPKSNLNVPVKHALVGKTKVECLRDSGCSGAVVANRLVHPEQYTDEIVLMKLIDSSILKVHMANIYVRTPWYIGYVHAMCLEHPIFDLVIGNVEGAREPKEFDPNFVLYPGSTCKDTPSKSSAMSEEAPECAVVGMKESVDEALDKCRVMVQSCEQMIHMGTNVIDRLVTLIEERANEVNVKTIDEITNVNDDINHVLTPSNDITGDEQIVSVVTRAQKMRNAYGPDTLKVADSIGMSVTRKEMIELQRADVTLAKYFKELPGPITKGRDEISFKFKEDVLYRVFQNTFVNNGNPVVQLVVPKTLRNEVLKLAHESVLGGHMAVQKTTDKVLMCFYWPGYSTDIVNFVRSCDVCQRTIPKSKVPKVDMQRMPIIDTPFKRVAVDLVGPLYPSSDNGYKYILTLVDYATRYPEAVPLKFITAQAVAEALVDIYSRIGIPEEILSDQGTQFMSEVMKQVNYLLSIKSMTTTPYHPQCNGLVERFNGTIKKMLQRMCRDQPRDWDRYINALLFAYREVPQASTGFAPFELVFGRTVRGPMQILKELWTNEDQDNEVKTTYQYVFDLRNRLESAMEVAREELVKSRETNKKYFDQKARDRKFSVGSKVLILLPTDHNKLLMEWKGPYEVVEQVAKHDYRLLIRGKLKVFHTNMLKEYVSRLDKGQESVSCSVAQYLRGPDVEITPIIESEFSCIDKGISKEPTSLISKEMDQSRLPIQSCCQASILEGESDCLSQDELLEFLPIESKESYLDVKIGSDLSAAQVKDMERLVFTYKGMFTDVPGNTNCGEHVIDLIEDIPVRAKPYNIPYNVREQLQQEVDEMLRLKVIRESDSPYASPVVMVRKKDGSNRVCIDFRKLNQKTVFDPEPIMRAEDIFADIGDSKYFIAIDLAKGYWQIPVRKEDIPKTAFVTPDGHYEYLKMPFGMVNSGATLIKCLRSGFNMLKPVTIVENGVSKTLETRKYVSFYVDDIIIKAKTWAELVAVAKEILRVLQLLGFTIRPSKCVFGSTKIDFLGKGIADGSLTLQEVNVKKILDAREPQTKSDIRSFIGMVGFYQSFIPNFATICAPLTDLTRKNMPNKIVFGPEHKKAYENLKSVITSDPVLKLPDLTKDFTLRTDASDRGLGAVLMQQYEDKLYPVAYASKKLNEAERRYSTMEKEGLAIVWAVRKFRMYLDGRAFMLETDHAPLVQMNRCRYANNRISRWCMFLQSFDIRIRGIKGADNHFADYLSRIVADIHSQEGKM